MVPRVQVRAVRFQPTASHKASRLHAPSAPLSPSFPASSPDSVLPPSTVPGYPSPLHSGFSLLHSNSYICLFLNLDTKLGSSLPFTWIPSLYSILLFPPQFSNHAPPCFAFLFLKSGSSILVFANAPVLSSMKNTSRAKCRGFACGGGKPGFRHLCPDCGKRFCPKCVRPNSRHACLPTVPAADPPTEESDVLINRTSGITRSEL